MLEIVQVKKGLEEVSLGFANKYFAEQFVFFCRTYQLCQTEENKNIYLLIKSWTSESAKNEDGITKELEPMPISIMTAAINDQLHACQGKLRVDYANKPNGIIFRTNTCFKGTPLGILSGLLRPLLF